MSNEHQQAPEKKSAMRINQNTRSKLHLVEPTDPDGSGGAAVLPWVPKEQADSVLAQTYDIPELRTAQKICSIADVNQLQMTAVLRIDRERLIAKHRRDMARMKALLNAQRREWAA